MVDTRVEEEDHKVECNWQTGRRPTDWPQPHGILRGGAGAGETAAFQEDRLSGMKKSYFFLKKKLLFF